MYICMHRERYTGGQKSAKFNTRAADLRNKIITKLKGTGKASYIEAGWDPDNQLERYQDLSEKLESEDISGGVKGLA